MSSPTVLVNNLVKEKDTTSTYIDPISKMYLIGELVMGTNRLVMFGKIKRILILLVSLYSAILCGIIFYTTFFANGYTVYNLIVSIDSMQYIFFVIINSLVWKRLKQYYRKLQEFDITLGCRPKRSPASIKNIIPLSIVACITILTLPYEWYMYEGVGQMIHIEYLPVRLLYFIGVHFYGHQLSLLVPRLRLINYYMKMSLNDHRQVVAPKVEELNNKIDRLETQNCQMKKLMDLYCLIIEAYDTLIDAIKWQFVMALTTTFISFLSFSYLAALMVIRSTRPFVHVAAEFAFTSTRLMPLFSPCIFCDQIQEEVRRLREHVASRLYEDKLNKPGRSVARALLALTEARDLSFSLLQIFDIDISLPFKFMGLLLTYLIILLQFEKFEWYKHWLQTMSSPKVLVNNLVKEEDAMYIDPISKMYLIGELVMGVNRLAMFAKIKRFVIFLFYVYSLISCGIIFYLSFFTNVDSVHNIVVSIDSLQYIITVLLHSLVWKRLKQYYRKLQEFDATIGCRPKRSPASLKNLIPLFIVSCVMILIIPYKYFVERIPNVGHPENLPVRLLYYIGVHYYGHLLSLLVPRLRLINYYMRISLNDHKQVEAPTVEEMNYKRDRLESENCQMKKLMDLYCLIIDAYDVLIDAIKWQFVMALTTTFISILSFSYLAALMIIRSTRPFVHVAAEFAFTSTRLIPLFSPCIFCDQIQEEVRRLREHVASRLYEDKLNKPGRSVARALLALTEARDLSFSLLQIFDIDISLPFKFMGLLLTYLIILLQFEKVINP